MFLILIIYTTINLLLPLTYYVNVNLELFIADCKSESSWQGELWFCPKQIFSQQIASKKWAT